LLEEYSSVRAREDETAALDRIDDVLPPRITRSRTAVAALATPTATRSLSVSCKDKVKALLSELVDNLLE
jgi:hypothetical protein